MPVYDSAGDVDARPAHLFRSGDHFAVSLDPTGSNIPLDGYEKWEHVSEFELGVHEAVPAAMNPEPILRGIRAYGYYIWGGFIRPPDRNDAMNLLRWRTDAGRMGR